ncbi:MAG: tetratricopeptide repeat protein [Elainellaceae cyanobacterium]
MKGVLNLFRSQFSAKPSATDEQQSRALSLQSTGFVCYQQGQYDAAVSYLESALTLWTVLGNFRAEQMLFQCLASCYWNLGEIQAAQCCYQEASTLSAALSYLAEAQVTI